MIDSSSAHDLYLSCIDVFRLIVQGQSLELVLGCVNIALRRSGLMATSVFRLLQLHTITIKNGLRRVAAALVLIS